ncbi:bifunctional dihydrofolate reductase-thymidylate synthase 2/DHFR-TS [Thecamonas trahens ATCC 50062]|uniref:Bifunctional dihydrofolate reductase-thymidylate synthase n=1 Tax=Thecamonas trahens ATCC 50062 TaxID=461836 RepID=A0A0L0D3U4_THETB|nr:bifunctional dihydrofolate reductase-thymidylate synthase 2/DHFR-TS [Thecamonas trahens ATCC 50062]KNC46776.1 bifunctional dihydrofolate reductase-thymidylate synthase 2/DHFR-TS [Thecamonas trahens ATCC 50062]|eukprot:XP_013760053.1 bifunctional dihydrofolate reductase-thymidylate synthase 2/DHFR-TS [Thecamonas trahens ATCC 50062]
MASNQGSVTATGPHYGLVVAVSDDGVIGIDGGLPWTLRGDMAHFVSVTKGLTPPGVVADEAARVVIMGRKTWNSIPQRLRPLKDRVNIVVSRTMLETPEGVHLARSLDDALLVASLVPRVGLVSVLGGFQLFAEAMQDPRCTWVELTEVHTAVREGVGAGAAVVTNWPGEVDLAAQGFFAEVSRSERHEESGIEFEYVRYERIRGPNRGELGYLDLIRRVLADGFERDDRTGVGTFSLFGEKLEFDLGDGFPLLTTKRVFWRGVAEELLWFVSGSTNANELAAKGIRIWDGNSSREYLDSIGLTEREVGDLGPVYGFQWRHFGAAYTDMHADYSEEGVDQLARIIETITTKPHDRRMVMSAWNPAALAEMALPPCHMFCQFYVADGKLSCQMYQRSCDIGLGVPFNIASYALLTHMVAHVTGLGVGKLTLVMGDAHVYKNHVEPLQRQLERFPRAFPSLRINREVASIDDFDFTDFEVVGYKPMKGIKMQMAV